MISFVAAGDSMIRDHLPNTPEFQKVRDFLKRGDIRFTNLEATIIDDTCFANTYSGGGYIFTEPYVLEDLKELGFNAVSCANNHAMDFSYNGVLNTRKCLKEAGIPCAGSGSSLYEASKPAFINTNNGRVALLCQAALGGDYVHARAGEPHHDFKSRPGINLLRSNKEFLVTPEQMAVLQEIVDKTDMHGAKKKSLEQGYTYGVNPELLDMSGVKFRLSDHNGYKVNLNQRDLNRMCKHINGALMNCDHAIVSLHCHAIRGGDDFIADYHVQEYAHACIDAGASAVIGHGTHVMQGIEIYKGKPIFYSLANFIYQIKYATRVPMDICETRGYDPEDVGADAMFRKLAPGSLTANERYYKTMLPYFEFEDGKLTKLEILPIKVCRSQQPYNMAGVPLAADPSEIIEQLEYASKPYGTEFEIDGDIIRVKL